MNGFRTQSRVLVVGGALLALVAAACGSPPVTPSTSAAPKSPVAGTTTSPTSSPVAAGPVDLVRLAMPQKATSLDPNVMLDQVSFVAMHLVGGTLNDLKPDGSGTTPGLASATTVSPDGLTMVFTLRPNLLFSDGTPLTAADVAATWKYYLGDEASVNVGVVAPIASVEASGTQDVVFKLKSPFPSIQTIVALPQYSVFPAAKLADPLAFFEQPVSAGPYAFAATRGDGTKLKLVVNPNYWGAKPLVQRIEIIFVQDVNTRVVQLKAGDIDVADAFPASVLPQFTDPLRVDAVTVPTGGVYLYTSNRAAPLNDVNVRKAIALAIDRNQINQIAFRGRSKPLLGFFGNSSQSNAASPILSESADVTQAKSLLQGTACASGCKITILQSGSFEDYNQIAIVVQQNLKQIGIDIVIEQVDPAANGTRLFEGNFELEVGNLYDYVDIPDIMLQYGLVSDGGIAALFSGYASPEMDKAAKAAVVSDGSARVKAIGDVNRIFARDMPYIPVVDHLIISASRVPATVFGLSPTTLYDVGRAP